MAYMVSKEMKIFLKIIVYICQCPLINIMYRAVILFQEVGWWSMDRNGKVKTALIYMKKVRTKLI